MRQLTAKQKKYLDKITVEYQDKFNIKPLSYDDLYPRDMEVLEKMNDTEILYQEISRYLWDTNFGN